MRRNIQIFILTLLCMLCVNIATAQDVRQKPVVKKQTTTTVKKQTRTKKQTATPKKQSAKKQTTTKPDRIVKVERNDAFEDASSSAANIASPNNIMIQETSPNNEDDKIFDIVEQMPTFPGGNGKLSEFLSQNVRYPVVAVENGIQGRVIVRFVVERDGSVSNVSVAKGVEASLDQEAVRVVKLMPKWNPGKQNGKAVRTKFNVPISFQLTGGSTSKPSNTITVRGQVVDKRGEPIIGASIIEEGTRRGAVSDMNGNFSMEVPKSGETKLSLSYVGCKKKTIMVDKNNNTPLKIVMK